MSEYCSSYQARCVENYSWTQSKKLSLFFFNPVSISLVSECTIRTFTIKALSHMQYTLGNFPPLCKWVAFVNTNSQNCSSRLSSTCSVSKSQWEAGVSWCENAADKCHQNSPQMCWVMFMLHVVFLFYTFYSHLICQCIIFYCCVCDAKMSWYMT